MARKPKRGFAHRAALERNVRDHNRDGCGSIAMHGPAVCRYGPDGICSGHPNVAPWIPPKTRRHEKRTYAIPERKR